MPVDLLVLGGGFSGLAVAHRARTQGLGVQVWEASEQVGGWVQTRDWPQPDGSPGHFDLGPQGLAFAQVSTLATLCQELGLSLVREAPRGPRWILEAEGLRPLPRGPAMLRALPWPGRLRVLLEPFRGPLPAGPASLADLARHRFGTAFASRLWPALIQGLAGAPPEGLDRDLLPAVARLDAWGGLLRHGRPLHRRVPEGGMGRLPATLARHLDLRLSQRAISLQRLAQGWEATSASGLVQVASRIHLALPAPAAAPLLAPHAPILAGLLDTLPHTDLWVRHTRHLPVPAWAAGFTLLVHPETQARLLGATSRALEGAPWMQVRTLGLAPCELPLPGLPPPLQEVVTVLPAALPRPHPGDMARLCAACQELPEGLEASGAWRWGPGLADLAEGVALSLPPPSPARR